MLLGYGGARLVVHLKALTPESATQVWGAGGLVLTAEQYHGLLGGKAQPGSSAPSTRPVRTPRSFTGAGIHSQGFRLSCGIF